MLIFPVLADAIQTLAWDCWWPLAAIAAAGLVLLAAAAYRYLAVLNRLRRATMALTADRERFRAAAEAERRRFNATLENVFDPHVLTEPVRDASGRIVDFMYLDTNAAACAWIGLDRDHLLGRRMLEVFPAVATTGLLKIFLDAANSGHPSAVESFPFPLAATGTHWLDIRTVPIDEHISFTWRDVTDRYIVAEKLAASEKQFRLLAENSSDVVVRIDHEGKIIWVSPSVTPVLGWSQADWNDHTVAGFFSSNAERAVFLREQEKTLSGQTVVVRARMLAREGVVHWVEIHAGPSRTAEGRIDGLVASFRIVDREMEAEQILERRARTDELTALLNRKEVIERIETFDKRSGRKIAALWCDIDKFKSVNDTYGHAAGDIVLQTLADRIRGCLRTTDDLGARIGGDELLIILHGVRDLQDALDIAEKLRRNAAEPIPTPAGPVSITLSIGVTLAHPDESTDALIARADDAMYQAKKRGRNQVVAIAESAVGTQR